MGYPALHNPSEAPGIPGGSDAVVILEKPSSLLGVATRPKDPAGVAHKGHHTDAPEWGQRCGERVRLVALPVVTPTAVTGAEWVD